MSVEYNKIQNIVPYFKEGQTVLIQYVYSDNSKVANDPDSLTIQIVSADQKTTMLTATKEATGQFTSSFTIPKGLKGEQRIIITAILGLKSQTITSGFTVV